MLSELYWAAHLKPNLNELSFAVMGSPELVLSSEQKEQLSEAQPGASNRQQERLCEVR